MIQSAVGFCCVLCGGWHIEQKTDFVPYAY